MNAAAILDLVSTGRISVWPSCHELDSLQPAIRRIRTTGLECFDLWRALPAPRP
jgi:hypothetical protein